MSKIFRKHMFGSALKAKFGSSVISVNGESPSLNYDSFCLATRKWTESATELFDGESVITSLFLHYEHEYFEHEGRRMWMDIFHFPEGVMGEDLRGALSLVCSFLNQTGASIKHVALSAESWSRTIDSKELEAYEAGSIGEHPDRVEIQILVCESLLGNPEHWIAQIKREPRSKIEEWIKSDQQIEGNFSNLIPLSIYGNAGIA